MLPLFIFPGVTEIDVPDCSGVDETTFVNVLKQCLAEGLHLSVLRLGLSGRCVSDSVMIELGYVSQVVSWSSTVALTVKWCM